MASSLRLRLPTGGPGATAGSRHRRSRSWAIAGVVLAAVAAFTLVMAVRAGREAVHAKNGLLQAEQHLRDRNLDEARVSLTAARQSLQDMKGHLNRLGPILPLSKLIPVVRSQVIAVETYQSAGTRLADAGIQLADAAQQATASSQEGTPVSKMVGSLRTINGSLAAGAKSVQEATDDVEGLRGRWLIGPIRGARDDLLDRLPRYAQQATDTEQGVSALITFAGGDGPRRYLFLSQNPDEIRPTGGFMGTYGVMTASAETLRLENFQTIQAFRSAHPNAVVPPDKAGSPFRFAVPPLPQNIANVNSTADFTKAGKLAVDLWNDAGETPVQGVVSFSPALLARVLAVVGPVRVEEYGETVDGGNVIDRFAFYTAQTEGQPTNDAVRKAFLSALSEVVLQRVLDAPSDRWPALAEAIGKGFAAREAMAWSADENVAAALAGRGWDGNLPKVGGDFFYNGEYGYQSKADRGLRRTFDHHVEVRPDGSARITTTITVVNTRDAGILNPGSLCYVTIYGPQGAKLDTNVSERPVFEEPAVSDHPAAGWFIHAAPHGSKTYQVVWDVEDLVRKAKDGSRAYSLTWLRVPDHSGDVLHLQVDLPDGWRWAGDAPPGTVPLEADVRGSWPIRAGGKG